MKPFPRKGTIYALCHTERAKPPIFLSGKRIPRSRFDETTLLKHMNDISATDGG